MRSMIKMQLPKLEKKKERTPQEEERLSFYKNGGDKVDVKNLRSLLQWLATQNA